MRWRSWDEGNEAQGLRATGLLLRFFLQVPKAG